MLGLGVHVHRADDLFLHQASQTPISSGFVVIEIELDDVVGDGRALVVQYADDCVLVGVIVISAALAGSAAYPKGVLRQPFTPVGEAAVRYH